jgi:hypothetical protein
MMYHVKKYAIAMGIMLVTSVVALLLVSTFAYVFKWQADKAMVGIIVTYILVGFAGGFGMRWGEKKEDGKINSHGIKKNVIETLLLSSMFMLFLLVVSIMRFQNVFMFSRRFLMIWGLMASSAFLGRWVGR